MMGHKTSRLSPAALGIGFGVACAIYMLAFAWSGWLGGYGKAMTDVWVATYPGFDVTFIGGIVAAVWGFAKGFIFGLLAGIFYNMCLRCCSSRCGCNCSSCNCNTGTGTSCNIK